MTEETARPPSARAATGREHWNDARAATGREHRQTGYRRRRDTGEQFDPARPPDGEYTDDLGKHWHIGSED